MMAFFSMFVETPSAATPAASVYRVKQPFGPRTVGPDIGFSVGLELEISEQASSNFRTVHAVTAGWLQVVRPDPAAFNPYDPLVLALQPNIHELKELRMICNAVGIETPLVFLYEGIDPASFRTYLFPVVEASPINNTSMIPEDKWDMFFTGSAPVEIPNTHPLGEASVANLSGGHRPVTFAIRTGPAGILDLETPPRNFLDPVVLFDRLIKTNTSDGNPAIDPSATTNSWLDVATRDRVLITVRNEWNEPLVDPSTTAHFSCGPASASVTLTEELAGTVVLPDGWSEYSILITDRKLTPIPSDVIAGDQITVSLEAPAHQVVSTVAPHEWFHPPDPGFTAPTFNLRRFTERNQIQPLIDGHAAFSALYADVQSMTSSNDFLLIAGWWTDHEFEMVPGVPDSTLTQMVRRADSLGSKVRAILWDFTGISQNTATHTMINGLTNGLSILDGRHQTIGSHHWKFTAIRNSAGTFVHLGGIDINPNRLDDPNHARNASRYHDVHCRISGPAAYDAVKAFQDRWNDHPDRQEDLAITGAASGQPGSVMARIARTYGAGDVQNYAPNGDRTILRHILEAVRKARNYVYIEDQYLVHPGIRDAIIVALQNGLRHVVFVIDGTCDLGIPGKAEDDCARARHLFLRQIRDAHPDRLHVFTLANHNSPYKVHTKVVIVDDIFATIGSANMGRRSMTHDSELNVFVLDGQVVDGARKFARDLRISLWGEHLGWQNKPGLAYARLANVDKAIEYLRQRPSSARLAPYDVDLNAGTSYPLGWDITDPDGTP